MNSADCEPRERSEDSGIDTITRLADARHGIAKSPQDATR